jgi:C1A family cysteine protease
MNALRSPDDLRDWVAESIYPSRDQLNLPKELDLRKELQPVRSQGSQGTCVVQAGACMKEWQELKDVKLDEYFSPQFIYNNRSNFPNSGMYGRDLMKILTSSGCCRELYFPYGTDKDNNSTSDEATKDAKKNIKLTLMQVLQLLKGLKKPCIKMDHVSFYFQLFTIQEIHFGNQII